MPFILTCYPNIYNFSFNIYSTSNAPLWYNQGNITSYCFVIRSLVYIISLNFNASSESPTKLSTLASFVESARTAGNTFHAAKTPTTEFKQFHEI